MPGFLSIESRAHRVVSKNQIGFFDIIDMFVFDRFQFCPLEKRFFSPLTGKKKKEPARLVLWENKIGFFDILEVFVFQRFQFFL